MFNGTSRFPALFAEEATLHIHSPFLPRSQADSTDVVSLHYIYARKKGISLLVTVSQLNLYARSKLELYLTVMREMQFLVRRASTNCNRHVFAHAMYACGVFVPLLHYPRASERATGAFPLPCQTGTAVLRSAVQHNKNTVSRYANTSRRTTQHETPHGPRPLSTSFQWRRTQ